MQLFIGSPVCHRHFPAGTENQQPEPQRRGSSRHPRHDRFWAGRAAPGLFFCWGFLSPPAPSHSCSANAGRSSSLSSFPKARSGMPCRWSPMAACAVSLYWHTWSSGMLPGRGWALPERWRLSTRIPGPPNWVSSAKSTPRLITTFKTRRAGYCRRGNIDRNPGWFGRRAADRYTGPDFLAGSSRTGLDGANRDGAGNHRPVRVDRQYGWIPCWQLPYRPFTPARTAKRKPNTTPNPFLAAAPTTLKRGWPWLTNDWVNTACAVAGGVIALILGLVPSF